MTAQNYFSPPPPSKKIIKKIHVSLILFVPEEKKIYIPLVLQPVTFLFQLLI